MKKICDIISDNNFFIIHNIIRLKYNIDRTSSVVKEECAVGINICKEKRGQEGKQLHIALV